MWSWTLAIIVPRAVEHREVLRRVAGVDDQGRHESAGFAQPLAPEDVAGLVGHKDVNGASACDVGRDGSVVDGRRVIGRVGEPAVPQGIGNPDVLVPGVEGEISQTRPAKSAKVQESSGECCMRRWGP